MKKKEIIETLNIYNLNKKKYIVISGAALVLQDIIEETKDIDLYVDKEYYEFLLKNYNCIFERTNELDEYCYMIDNIINFGKTFCPKNIKMIDEIKVSSIDDVLELKKYLNRKKDEIIIKKIERERKK